MKKIIALISAAAIALTLTACNNTENTSGTPNNSVPASSVASQPADPDSSDVPAGPDNSTSADVPADPDSSDVPADPDNSIVIVDDPNNPGGDEPAIDNSILEFPDNRAGRMVKAALELDGWAQLMLLDEEMISFSFPDLKTEDCEEFCIATSPMSAVLNYAIAVKPKAGSESAVKTAFETFRQAKQDDQMLYPSHQIIAQEAIVDEDGGYIYVIFHEDPQAVANAMTAAQ